MKAFVPIRTIKKSVKHVFTVEERSQLSTDLLKALEDHSNAEAEFDAIKASYKAKITEAESRVGSISTSMRAGWEMRIKDCSVTFRPEDRKKDFFVSETRDGMIVPVLVLTEDMTPDDFQEDLLRAEAAFSKKKELALWDASEDHGKLIVGEQGGRWFSALRCNIGQVKLEERLDSEQMSFKARWPAIQRAAKRCVEWVAETMGKDASKGICELVAKAIDAEKENVE